MEGHRVVSGSDNKTVQIWNATGEVEIELEGHRVKSVAFSQDGSLVASGSYSDTVLIWNVMTGEVEAELVGDNHESVVTSVEFSQDGSRVVSGLDVLKSYISERDDGLGTVKIWNIMTGQVEAELMSQTEMLNAFAQDGS